MSDSEDRYNNFYKKGKKYFKANQYDKCLEALKNAYELRPSDTLQNKINKLESLLSKDEEDEEIKFRADENKLLIDNRFYVDSASYQKLYHYQKEGILWLFKLFESRKGGILADDMGLGKTVQFIFFIRELFESDLIKTSLIVMPKSLLINWEREFSKWAPDITVLMYTGNERERNLNRIRRRGGVLLTTYGTIMNSWEELNYDSTFKWNVLALDEGHKIKNPSSKTFKSVNAIRAVMRLVMTGTAVQNKLKELWALFDFTHQGSLLGSYSTFSIEYERPITQSRNKDASESEKMYGNEISASLKGIIKPFFLRRTKEEVIKGKTETDTNLVPNLMRKNDLIIWVQMTDAQIKIYQSFLQLDEIKQLLTMREKRSPLLELNILKKICDHPRLLKSDHCAELGLPFANSINDVDINLLQQESGKMEFLVRLLMELVGNHKCLVFSQSKVVLNVIERILISNKVRVLRLDGDILRASDRQIIVDTFNTDPKFRVLLLTSQVGGVGLTLTGADRAIIYDLNWNPSIDAQAVDRLYRIGQLNNVVVYRLITCGTVEEKIYRRQIFKDSLNRQTTGIQETDNNPYRYFTQGELRELFTLDDPHMSNTQIQLEKMHSKHRNSDLNLDDHVLWLMDQNIFGITDHDLMFSQGELSANVDDETMGRLVDNRKQAENRVVTEALTLANDEDGQLRLLMSKMSLAEKKSKIKEVYNPKDLFIPSRNDIKRPGYNVLPKSLTPPLINPDAVPVIRKPFRQNPKKIYEYLPPVNLFNKLSSENEVIESDNRDDIQRVNSGTKGPNIEDSATVEIVDNKPVIVISDSDEDMPDYMGNIWTEGLPAKGAARASHIIEYSDNEDLIEDTDDESVKSTKNHGSQNYVTQFRNVENAEILHGEEDSEDDVTDSDYSDEESVHSNKIGSLYATDSDDQLIDLNESGHNIDEGSDEDAKSNDFLDDCRQKSVVPVRRNFISDDDSDEEVHSANSRADTDAIGTLSGSLTRLEVSEVLDIPRFCPDCLSLLFAQPDEETRTLIYKCYNCEYKEISTDYRVYENRTELEIDELSRICTDVIYDPTLITANIPCEKCKHPEAVTFRSMTYKNRHSMKWYCVCKNETCLHKWERKF